jgi:proline iminopeptidase
MEKAFLLVLLITNSSRAFHPSTLRNSQPPLPQKESKLRELYPSLMPFDNGTIMVDTLHTLFYQQYGSCNGIPALFLHGGPGAGCFPRHARFFDPAKYRIILLDQRGSGESTPKGEIRNNTICHLIHDCEMLRTKLQIGQWGLVLGGSWGSTLALAYAQTHPTKIRHLILRGLCLFRAQEVDWLFGSNGISNDKRLQEQWNRFNIAVGIESINDNSHPRKSLHAYYDRLLSSDHSTRLNAAKSWAAWEHAVSSLRQDTPNDVHCSQEPLIFVFKQGRDNSRRIWGTKNLEGEFRVWNDNQPLPEFRKMISYDKPSNHNDHSENIRPIQTANFASEVITNLGEQFKNYVPAQAMLTCFYSVNRGYVMNQINLLDQMHRIHHIPCTVIHGEQDFICPIDSALDACDKYPTIELRIPIGSGHSMYDPLITHELVTATDQLSAR